MDPPPPPPQQHQQQRQPSPPPPPSQPQTDHDEQCFQEGVTEIIMACEELRQPFKDATTPITTDLLVTAREDLDLIFQNLGAMHEFVLQQTTTDKEQQIRRDLFHHCQTRVFQVAQRVLERALASPEPQEDEKRNNDTTTDAATSSSTDYEVQEAQQQLELERQEFQASLARITELNLILCLQLSNHTTTTSSGANATTTPQTIVQNYVANQRNALRERAKPSIARLVQERRDDNHTPGMERLPHSHVITVILGQASALIHPLLAWMFSLPPPPPSPSQRHGQQQEENKLVEFIRQLCGESVEILDEQAQSLTKTVSDWFWTDRNVDDWMAKSNNSEHEGFGQDDNHKLYLGELDGLVEEMAFVCQVLARYQAMIQNVPWRKLQTTIEHELSPEWTWKYASLERFLATQQWKSALMLATPVYIVLGTSIQVPSVVEDAQYLSTRALERAASTRSSQAIGTVAHSISSHVWSTDITGGVHQALADQIGCHVDESTQQRHHQHQGATSPPRTNNTSASTNSFASALLDALDDDIGKDAAPSAAPPKPPSSGPASGGLFQSLVGGGGDALQQLRINTDFCNLNGIHSASAACRSLVKFLDGLLENQDAIDDDNDNNNDSPNKQMNAMIQLAREELSHYGRSYDIMLKAQVQHVIERYCGSLHDPPQNKRNCPCIPLLRHYFLNEDFELNQSTFKEAESDSRLERELLGSLNESKFLQQSNDKCDADVLLCIREQLTLILVELILDCLLHAADPPKRFTDWGSLLLSKQVRMLQLYLSKLQDNSTSACSSGPINSDSKTYYEAWERLSQVVTVLQLERPSDWLLYDSTSVLTPDELRRAMQLRVDFSTDAIHKIVGDSSGAAGTTAGGKGDSKMGNGTS